MFVVLLAVIMIGCRTGTAPRTTNSCWGLCVGCIVRIVVGLEKKRGWEKIYFQITKIKDGSVWGIAQDTYRSDDYILPYGASFSFRLNDILEIPLAWQPTRRIQKELESYLIVTPTPPPT
eukprot:TRINITY_DN6074_c0_g1_i2.p1 TRINITY_DN6074_c0_g1~~TRINITY_DN6074_c0_g1_i2.p1  ORF type:complete len:120 (+),score=8.48 TRINITY_DN6074_c0_g1_i2:100-459(+)